MHGALMISTSLKLKSLGEDKEGWQDFKNTLMSNGSQLKVDKPYVDQHLSNMLMKESVGYLIIDTSSILHKQAQQVTFGLFATSSQGNAHQAQAIISNPRADALRLALEAARAAQLLAYQNGWLMKVIIQTDVEEIIPI